MYLSKVTKYLYFVTFHHCQWEVELDDLSLSSLILFVQCLLLCIVRGFVLLQLI